jgi:hypothetical protein
VSQNRKTSLVEGSPLEILTLENKNMSQENIDNEPRLRAYQKFEDESDAVAQSQRDEWVLTTQRDIRESGGRVDEVKKNQGQYPKNGIYMCYADAAIYYYPRRLQASAAPATRIMSKPIIDQDGRGQSPSR